MRHGGRETQNLAIAKVQQLHGTGYSAGVRVGIVAIVVEHQFIQRRQARTQVAAVGIVPFADLLLRDIVTAAQYARPHTLLRDDKTVQSFPPQLTDIQLQTLDLLGIQAESFIG